MNWQIKNNQYVGEIESFQFCSQAGELEKGVNVTFQGKPLVQAFPVLMEKLTVNQDQSFVRGKDLVGSFSLSENVFECYWRLMNFGDLGCGLDAIFSLRSNRQTTGSIDLKSLLHPFADKSNSMPGFSHCHDPQLNCHALLVVHPVDLDAVELHQEDKSLAIGIQLNEMERGVIRRIRMRMQVGVGELSDSQIEEFGSRFSESDLPLTT